MQQEQWKLDEHKHRKYYYLSWLILHIHKVHTHIHITHTTYHDRLASDRSHRADARHGAPIELAARTDAIGATAEHHHTAVVKGNVVFSAIVCAVAGKKKWVKERHIKTRKRAKETQGSELDWETTYNKSKLHWIFKLTAKIKRETWRHAIER